MFIFLWKFCEGVVPRALPSLEINRAPKTSSNVCWMTKCASSSLQMTFLHHYNHLANWKLLPPLCKWEHQRFRDVKSCAHCIQGRSGIPTQGPWFPSPFCFLPPMLPDSLWSTSLLGFYAMEWRVFLSTYDFLQIEGKLLYHWQPQSRVGWEERNCLAWFFTAGG